MSNGALMPVLVYILSAFGLAYVLGHSVITKVIREWAYDFGVSKRLVPVKPTAAIMPGSYTTGGLYPLRWLVQLVECPMCLGFWIGVVTWLTIVSTSPTMMFMWLVDILIACILGCFTAGSNFILGRATGLVPHPREH